MYTLKKFFAIVFIIVLCITLSQAQNNIFVANNNPGASGGVNVSTSLGAALTAAKAAFPSGGAIIHVIPSSVSHGNVTVDFSVSIYGIGTDVSKEGANRSITGQIHVTTGGDNVVLSGLRVENRILLANAGNANINGLLIENCYVVEDIAFNVTNYGGCSVGNVTIRSNVIGGSGGGTDRIFMANGTASNISITNNIIVCDNNTVRAGIQMGGNFGAVITNNLFYGNGGTSTYAYEQINTATIKNNIFYGVQPLAITTYANNVILNNLSWAASGTGIYTFAGGTNNTLTANIENTADPNFVNVPATGSTAWNFTNDAHLTAGSPAEGTGDDSLDRGITGGNIPFNFAGTNLPVVQQLNIPSAIIQGNPLPATIKAAGN